MENGGQGREKKGRERDGRGAALEQFPSFFRPLLARLPLSAVSTFGAFRALPPRGTGTPLGEDAHLRPGFSHKSKDREA